VPEDVGLDPRRLGDAKELLFDGLRAGQYTTAVYIVGRHGKIAMQGTMGRLGAGLPFAEIDSVFDMASVTKPVVTATSALILADRGSLDLDQPVADFFPERKLSHLSGVTLKHLATHTSGLPAWRALYSRGQSRREAMNLLLHTRPTSAPGDAGVPPARVLENAPTRECAPGERYEYSCLGYIIMGLVIERVSGMTLADFAEENILGPLGMADTRFNPPSDWEPRIVRTADCPMSRRTSVAQVQDGNALAMEGVSGNAGLFSTAPNMAVFAQVLLNGGEFGGVRVLSKESVERMFTNQIGALTDRQSIGFFMVPNVMLPCDEGWSDRCAGHTGFTGTCLVVDPELDMFAVLLANKLYEYRDPSDFFATRRELLKKVVEALA